MKLKKVKHIHKKYGVILEYKYKSLCFKRKRSRLSVKEKCLFT